MSDYVEHTLWQNREQQFALAAERHRVAQERLAEQHHPVVQSERKRASIWSSLAARLSRLAA